MAKTFEWLSEVAPYHEPFEPTSIPIFYRVFSNLLLDSHRPILITPGRAASARSQLTVAPPPSILVPPQSRIASPLRRLPLAILVARSGTPPPPPRGVLLIPILLAPLPSYPAPPTDARPPSLLAPTSLPPAIRRSPAVVPHLRHCDRPLPPPPAGVQWKSSRTSIDFFCLLRYRTPCVLSFMSAREY